MAPTPSLCDYFVTSLFICLFLSSVLSEFIYFATSLLTQLFRSFFPSISVSSLGSLFHVFTGSSFLSGFFLSCVLSFSPRFSFFLAPPTTPQKWGPLHPPTNSSMLVLSNDEPEKMPAVNVKQHQAMLLSSLCATALVVVVVVVVEVVAVVVVVVEVEVEVEVEVVVAVVVVVVAALVAAAATVAVAVAVAVAIIVVVVVVVVVVGTSG